MENKVTARDRQEDRHKLVFGTVVGNIQQKRFLQSVFSISFSEIMVYCLLPIAQVVLVHSFQKVPVQLVSQFI